MDPVLIIITFSISVNLSLNLYFYKPRVYCLFSVGPVHFVAYYPSSTGSSTFNYFSLIPFSGTFYSIFVYKIDIFEEHSNLPLKKTKQTLLTWALFIFCHA